MTEHRIPAGSSPSTEAPEQEQVGDSSTSGNAPQLGFPPHTTPPSQTHLSPSFPTRFVATTHPLPWFCSPAPTKKILQKFKIFCKQLLDFLPSFLFSFLFNLINRKCIL